MWRYKYILICGHPPRGGVSRMYLHPHSSNCGTWKNHCKYQCFLNTLYVKWCLLQSSFKNPILQNRNPVLHFQNFHQKMNKYPLQEFWRSPSKNTGNMHFLGQNKILHKTFICKGPRFPRILMSKVQDSCTGPRFLRIPKILELLGETLTKFQKILGFLGILGLCMNPALCSSGFSGILSLYRFCSL